MQAAWYSVFTKQFEEHMLGLWLAQVKNPGLVYTWAEAIELVIGLCCLQVCEKSEDLVIKHYSQTCTQGTLIRKSKNELTAAHNFPFVKVTVFCNIPPQKYNIYWKIRPNITLRKLRDRAGESKKQM